MPMSTRAILEKEIAPGVVLFHVALEGLLAGQLVAVQGDTGQGSELAQLGRDTARELIVIQVEESQGSELPQLGRDAA